MSGSNDLFDDVLHELMLEGSRPSYEALLRRGSLRRRHGEV